MSTINKCTIGRSYIQAYPGKLHICADGWTSPNVVAFIGTTVHCILDGKIVSAILDFIKATKAHTGVYLAARIAECLREYKIQDKIMGFTADNAANNDTLVRELSVIVPSFPGKKTRVRCFAHILNLIVKAILSPFSRKTSIGRSSDSEIDTELDMIEEEMNAGSGMGDEEVELDDDDEIAADVQMSDNADVESIDEEADLDGRLDPLSSQDINVGRLSIAKLRTLATKIVNSPTIKEDLQDCCRKVGIPVGMMVRDVSTRWNSTADLIQRALELEEALKVLVVKTEFNKPRGVRLARFRLSAEEWSLLRNLSPLLEVFSLATKRISQSRIPLLHEVIPIFDKITEALDDFIDDVERPACVRHAALRELLMLNKYYALTDDSVVYRIAMILHPRHKMMYFTKAKWEQSWIDTAGRIIREEWTENYKPKDKPVNTAQDGSLTRTSSFARKYFDSLNDDIASTADALEEWLASPVVNTALDPVDYWTQMDRARNPLARMALDYLSIPASSTDVERSFSRGGLTISKLRHSLSDDSARAACVMGSWASLDDAIPKDRILASFKAKRQRSKKKARTDNSSIVIVDD
ncbi:hypothetical protein D9613_006637 [Agrocybe pediades]|uniref:HAT C-terminal dimerisation domain-containing protein n=1 Tax=Agrocybe pediades TaxID=84607 RepID=A0A8H4QHH0_9AGAR|nr:hypothetical protein D9613_006637 [Agrocybe pediades]